MRRADELVFFPYSSFCFAFLRTQIPVHASDVPYFAPLYLIFDTPDPLLLCACCLFPSIPSPPFVFILAGFGIDDVKGPMCTRFPIFPNSTNFAVAFPLGVFQQTLPGYRPVCRANNHQLPEMDIVLEQWPIGTGSDVLFTPEVLLHQIVSGQPHLPRDCYLQVYQGESSTAKNCRTELGQNRIHGIHIGAHALFRERQNRLKKGNQEKLRVCGGEATKESAG